MAEAKARKFPELSVQDAVTVALVALVVLFAVNRATSGGLGRFVRMSLIPGAVAPEAETYTREAVHADGEEDGS